MPASQMAVLWDMDGVIADTAACHMEAWREAFRSRGVTFTEEDFRRTFGTRNEDIIRRFVGEGVTEEEVKAIADEKEADYCRRAGRDIEALPGVVDLLEGLRKAGFRQALVSSTPMENIRLVLDRLSISGYFEHIIGEEDVTEGKPSPQGFLLAARRLRIDPGCCVVIEDAVAGVAAARNAGMRCVAVTNTHPRDSLAEADLVVDSLREVTAATFRELVRSAGAGKRKEERRMERSLVLIKPDAMERGLAGVIIARLQQQGLKLRALKMLQMDEALARRHYAVHQGKGFFEDLVSYITSTPIVASVFEGENAVEAIRSAMGATDPAKAEAGTIRAEFGLDIQRNATHASDSPETAEAEIGLFFSEDEIFQY